MEDYRAAHGRATAETHLYLLRTLPRQFREAWGELDEAGRAAVLAGLRDVGATDEELRQYEEDQDGD